MFRPCTDLTPKERQALTEMRAGMLWSQGFFSHLLLDQCNLVPSRDVPIAATDGVNIFVNPGKFSEYNIDQRMYVLCHEICHVMWEHIETTHQMRGSGIIGPHGMLPWDDQLVNECMDYTINALLDECKIGARPAEGHYSHRYKGGESWVGIYAEEYEKRKGQGQQPGGGGGAGSGQPPSQNPGGFDQHLPPGAGTPGKTPSQAVQDRKDKQTEWAQAINQAMEVAKARGDVPAALKRLVEELIEPKVDWQDKLAATIVKRIGGGGSDWRNPEEYMCVFTDPVYVPKRRGKGVGTVVVAVDTSGSVGQRELSIMGGAMSGIFEQAMPEKAYVLDCDAAVHSVRELDNPDDIEAVEMIRSVEGGGGTAFQPVFDRLDELDIKPDVLVYLTDGYGDQPSDPGYPVVWAIIPGGENSIPWGDVVQLEI